MNDFELIKISLESKIKLEIRQTIFVEVDTEFENVAKKSDIISGGVSIENEFVRGNDAITLRISLGLSYQVRNSADAGPNTY